MIAKKIHLSDETLFKIIIGTRLKGDFYIKSFTRQNPQISYRFFITLFIADLRNHNRILIFVTWHCHDCIIVISSLRTCEYMFTYQFVISTKLCICFIKLCWYVYVRECISRSLHTFSCVAIVAAISRKIKNLVWRLITYNKELMLLFSIY